MTYPVVDQHTLTRVPARFLLPRRRALHELPAQPSGTVLVASIDGECELLSHRDLSPTNDTIVNASSVAVVDTRPGRRAIAELEIASADVAQPFIVRAVFTCKVTDPVAVVRSAPHDIVPELVSHLVRDHKLMSLGQRLQPEEVGDFERHARARITAVCMGRPPSQPGMTIELDHVEVPPADALRSHARDVANEKRRQELEAMKTSFSRDQARLIEAILNRGPEAIEALYLELGDDRYLRSTERAYDERDTIEARLRELIGMLAERGHFDRVAIDTPRLMDEFVDGLLQSRARRLGGDGSGRSIVLGGGAGAVDGPEPSLPGPDGDGPDDTPTRPPDPPDEDELDG